ncbi:MAG TPA: hypothetical protein VK961_05225 [Chthoniobacter sp.]|nr:hypothetical protein [Chthoniobacter sp.]
MFPHSISRRFCLHLCAVFTLGSFGITAHAADSAAESKTLLAERGKLLVTDDLNAAPAAPWKVAKGKWELADGVWHGEEVPADNHPGVIRRPLGAKDVIIQYSIKLEGGKQATLSINTEKEHLCRVLIRPDAFIVQKDDMDHDGPDKAIVFKTIKTEIKPGEWHTVLVEILGNEMVASLDGDKVGFGSHEVIAREKANFGFTIGGGGVALKNLRVWEATPNKSWAETKAKLALASTK